MEELLASWLAQETLDELSSREGGIVFSRRQGEATMVEYLGRICDNYYLRILKRAKRIAGLK